MIIERTCLLCWIKNVNPRSNRLGTFGIWNNQRIITETQLLNKELLSRVVEITSKDYKNTIILLNYLPTNDQIKTLESLISQKLKTSLKLRLLQKFDGSLYRYSNFYLFIFKENSVVMP